MQIKIKLTIFILLLSCSIAFSQGYYIKNYAVDIDIQSNGELEIDETITVIFEKPRRGIIRNIPYTYMWETGVQTDMIFDLAMGQYTVTVADVNGCTSIVSAVIDIETSNHDIPDLERFALFPNPTEAMTNIDFELANAKAAILQVYNGYGQLLERIESSASTTHQFDIDTSRYPNGIYFIRINVDHNAISKRLLVQH